VLEHRLFRHRVELCVRFETPSRAPEGCYRPAPGPAEIQLPPAATGAILQDDTSQDELNDLKVVIIINDEHHASIAEFWQRKSNATSLSKGQHRLIHWS
jgi:hypothetical protein